VPGGDVIAIQRIGVGQQVSELGERVAADAGDGRPAPAVFADEVLDDMQVEAVLEIEDVVGDADGMGNIPGIIDRIEGAAGPVRHIVAVTEELHRGAYHLVALFDETRRRY
jgi:hypothetical protein